MASYIVIIYVHYKETLDIFLQLLTEVEDRKTCHYRAVVAFYTHDKRHQKHPEKDDIDWYHYCYQRPPTT